MTLVEDAGAGRHTCPYWTLRHSRIWWGAVGLTGDWAQGLWGRSYQYLGGGCARRTEPAQVVLRIITQTVLLGFGGFWGSGTEHGEVREIRRVVPHWIASQSSAPPRAPERGSGALPQCHPPTARRNGNDPIGAHPAAPRRHRQRTLSRSRIEKPGRRVRRPACLAWTADRTTNRWTLLVSSSAVSSLE